MAFPREIRKRPGGTGMKIIWDDGRENDYSARDLRLNCHCAACRHEVTGEILLKPESIPAHLTIEKAEIIGQYALGFHFSDGHSTGIYTFDFLREMGHG